MQNFDEASGAMTAMADSEGALSDANDIYMDSIKAHVQQLKNVFTEFSQSALSKDLIDMAVDLAKAILQIVSAIMKVSKFLGGIKTIIPLVITLVTIIKGASIAKMIDNVIVRFKGFGTLISTVFKNGVTSVSSFKQSLSEVEGQAATTGSAINAALGVIGLIATAISLVSSIISNAVNEHRQALQTVVDSGNEAAKTSDNIYELYTTYQNAREAGENVTESQNALIDALRKSGASFDAASDKAANYTNKLEQLTLQQLEYESAVQKSGIQAEKELIESSKEYDKFWSDFAFKQLGLTDTTAEVSSKANIGSWAKKVLGIDSLDIDYLATHLDELKGRVVELREAANDTALDSQENKNAERALAFVQGLDEVLGDYSVDISNLHESIARISFMQLNKEIPKTEKEFEAYRASLIDAIKGNIDWAGSADDAANAADRFLSQTSGFENFYSAVEKVNSGVSTLAKGLRGIADLQSRTTNAFEELDKFLNSGNDWDTNQSKRVEYYSTLLEEMEKGNFGGQRYTQLAESFGINVNKSVEKQIAGIKTLSRYYSDLDAGLENFLNDIASSKIDDSIATWNADTQTLWWDPTKLNQFAKSLGITKDMLLDLLNTYRMNVSPSDWIMLEPSQLKSWLEADGLMTDIGDKALVNRARIEAIAKEYGYSADEIIAKLKEIEDVDEISLDLSTTANTEEALQRIQGFLTSVEAESMSATDKLWTLASALSGLDAESVKDILINLSVPDNFKQEIISMLPDDLQAELGVNDEQADQAIAETTSKIEELGLKIDGIKDTVITIRIDSNIDDFANRLATAINFAESKGVTINTTKNATKNATGTKNAKPGLSLLGDEYSSTGKPKPELVVSNGYAYLAGVNGPVVSKLNAGDIVYTYRQTKEILGNNLNRNFGIPAFSTGRRQQRVPKSDSSNQNNSTSDSTNSNSSTKDEETWFEKLYKKKNHLRKMDKLSDKKYFKWLNSAYKLAYSQGIMELDDYRKYREEVYEGYKKTFTDAYDKKNHLRNMDKLSDEKYLKWLRKAVAKAKKNGKLTAQESWKYEEEILKLSTDIQKKKVQEQIAAKQHQVAMNKITENNYYTWLNSKIDAWYKKGKITLDEYRKYQEEIYNYNKNKAKEVLDDYYTDLDHYITMLENRGNPVSEIIEADKKGMTQASAEIQELMLQGKNNNDEEVQKLQDIWWKYYKDWEERTKDANDSAKESTEKLIDYTVDMLKKGLEKEKEVLNKRLSAIQEFYSKQKELLQDSYDEDKYLEEQAEKRKAVSDLELQLSQIEYDNSAWAQKRRLELQQQLTDAKKDLDNFEKDHALKTAQGMLDDLQKLQEEEMNNEIDVLEEKLDDEAQLRRDALQLIAENPQETYARMVEYEDLYGTGDIQNVIDLWNEAAEARDNYYNINGSYYQGLTLGGYKYSEGLVDVSSIWAGYGNAATTKQTAQNNAKNRTPYVAPYFTPSTFLSTYGSDTAILTNQAILPAGVSTKNKKANDAAWMQSLMKLISGASNSDEFMRSLSLNNLTKWSNSGTMPQISGGVGQSFTMGNIIINGNADNQTISQIRREQRNQLDTLLKELNKLNK